MVPKTLLHKSIVISGSTSEIDRACEQILNDIRGNNYDQQGVFAIHLALKEAFLNAIRHGNKKDPTKQISIEYSMTSEKFDISITDEGGGFKPDEIPDPRSEENLCKPYGRGVLLMRAYMDEVEYNQTGNCVHMVKYKAKSGN